ncbi:MAG: AAA-like domain-containing protein [Chloroflexi bacterium]|nr:AAA-like domain-containing protein [Chloroflexota bacterium]
MVNPFTYGNPVTVPQRFFGRRQEVAQIFNRLRNPEGESTSVVGERRAGKTSLLYYLSHPDVMRQQGLTPEQYIFVYLDLEMVTPTTTSTRLFQHMLRRLLARLREPEMREAVQRASQLESIDAYHLADILEQVDRAGLHIILLLDEFENLGANENFGPDFYYALRALAIHHNLALVTCSRRNLVEICQSQEVRSSRFFNIFANIHLQPFSMEDVHELLHASLHGTDVAFSDRVVEYAVGLAGRQPFFLQMAFYTLFEACHQGMSEEDSLRLLRDRLAEEASPHFAAYWEPSSMDEQIVLAILALQEAESGAPLRGWTGEQLDAWYRGASAIAPGLLHRALLTQVQDGYAVASRAFGAWIRTELASPGASPKEGGQRSEQEAGFLEAVPPSARAGIEGWLRVANTPYRPLLLRWLAGSPKPLAVLRLLPGAAAARETPTLAELAEREGAHFTVTDAERAIAQQQASPEGIVSILFTDLEGSTALFTTLGDEEAQQLLLLHNHMVREQVARYGGIEMKTLGDGFLLVFPSARRAAECAQAVQRAFDAYNAQHAHQPLKVRIGIHAGEVLKGEEFLGSAVNLASRVMHQAVGGEILVSGLFRELIAGVSQIRCVERGWRRLKGFKERQHIFEVPWRPDV